MLLNEKAPNVNVTHMEIHTKLYQQKISIRKVLLGRRIIGFFKLRYY